MRIKAIARLCAAGAMLAGCALTEYAAEQSDSVYLFAYKTEPGHGGLRLAWSADQRSWQPIGQGEGIEVVKSDFGPWGSYKTMYEPLLYRMPGGWRLIFWGSGRHQTLAAADSPDLISWRPQRYVEAADSAQLFTSSMIPSKPCQATVAGKDVSGGVSRISRLELDKLLAHEIYARIKRAQNAERLTDDVNHPALSLPVKLTARRSAKPAVRVSPHLFGIFFEDINYGADGGLYAELIQNRDFEYRKGESGMKGWGPGYAWSLSRGTTPAELTFSTADPIHANNPTYLSLASDNKALTLTNSGYDGITLRKGATYRFSMIARTPNADRCKVKVELVKGRRTLATVYVKVPGTAWNNVEASLKPSASVSGAELRLTVPAGVQVDLDMISLFPSDTFRGRKNGLRRDMAEALDSLHPRFVRFPGGCVAHGNDIDNIYDWKGSIGPLESRRPLYNLWGYHQTRGLGYHEYFLLCEDLGAEPLPVLAAGVPCQNSGRTWSGAYNELTTLGQQGGLPQEMMPQYIQDVLDLIEYANGPADSQWGSKRAAAGHPEPFNLKYIGIGNEDMITDVFEDRFRQIFSAVREAHPEITVVGTAGPFYEGADYDEGWRLARELGVPVVDEHYYVEPGWLMNNRGFYDNYPRNGSTVYLGEYASHLPGRPNNMETALSTALYLTDVERNADVVTMSSYAPLFAKRDHTQWRPDMIYFDNDSVTLTTDYWVQWLFSNNQGDEYLPVELTFDTFNPEAARRIGYSVMRDRATGDLIFKIVNVLPSELTVTAPASGFPGEAPFTSATMTTLAGSPDNSEARPVAVPLSPDSDLTLPPYSLTIVRLSR